MLKYWKIWLKIEKDHKTNVFFFVGEEDKKSNEHKLKLFKSYFMEMTEMKNTFTHIHTYIPIPKWYSKKQFLVHTDKHNLM